MWKPYLISGINKVPIYLHCCGIYKVYICFKDIEIQSLWKGQTVVLFFLRRFGCQVCRWTAAEISKLEPDLRANNIALVGIGPEETGLHDFRELGFFKGGGIFSFSILLCDEYKTCPNTVSPLWSLWELHNSTLHNLHESGHGTRTSVKANACLSIISPEALYLDEKKKTYKDLGFKRWA